MNYRELIGLMRKHREDLITSIEMWEKLNPNNAEYFKGALDEVDLLIKCLETMIKWDAEDVDKINELLKWVEVSKEKRKLND